MGSATSPLWSEGHSNAAFLANKEAARLPVFKGLCPHYVLEASAVWSGCVARMRSSGCHKDSSLEAGRPHLQLSHLGDSPAPSGPQGPAFSLPLARTTVFFSEMPLSSATLQLMPEFRAET